MIVTMAVKGDSFVLCETGFSVHLMDSMLFSIVDVWVISVIKWPVGNDRTLK
jgi:hypothetical protein